MEPLRARFTAKVGRLFLEADLDTGPGTLVIAGPNGSGKSSLLSALLGVLPARGRISVGDRVLLDTEAGLDIPVENRRLGYVPQDYALFPHWSVRKNVEFALLGGPGKLDREARLRRVGELLRGLGLEGLAERIPGSLSGGEKQRVALARALSVQPRALLLDEPLAALDVASRQDVRGFLKTYLSTLELPCIVVSHDAEDARVLGHRIAVLEQGRFTQTGTWEELEHRPGSPFVERFVASG